MSGLLDYMQLCRLCLVKEKVNVPIFGEPNDVQQLFLKITACLPVKISQDDNLPKKICDSCVYKVDLLYQFWNTTVNAEKQLVQWLTEIGVDVGKDTDLPAIQMSHAHPHSIETDTILLKEERSDTIDIVHNEVAPPAYAPTTQMMFGSFNQTFTQGNNQSIENDSKSINVIEKTKPVAATPPKRRGRPPLIKKEPAPATATSTKSVSDESMDESSSDRVGMQDDSDDSMDETGDRIAKEEAESEEEFDENAESLEPTTFVGVPTDNPDDQPGPSGLNKPMSGSSSDPGKRDRQIPTFDFVPVKCEKEDTPGFICQWCGKTFTKKLRLKRHQVIHNEKTIPCDLCNLKFKTISRMRQHKKYQHLNHEKNYECNICGKKFTKEVYKHHMARHDKKYTCFCDECGKGFYASNALRDHVKVTHQGIKFICFPCNWTTASYGHYSTHMKNHDPDFRYKEFKCNLCEKSFKLNCRLTQHLKRSHPNEDDKVTYVCDVCGKALTSIKSLNDHRRLHTGEKPFVCNFCGKPFRSRGLLQGHVLIHTKEKRHKCTICEKSFTQRTTLVVHMRSHTGERPYKCNFCSNGFITRSLLNTHLKTQHHIAS